MKKKRLRAERQRLGLSGLELSRRSRVAPAVISQAELGRLIPYPVQLGRLAEALGWTGDPEELLEDLEE